MKGKECSVPGPVSVGGREDLKNWEGEHGSPCRHAPVCHLREKNGQSPIWVFLSFSSQEFSVHDCMQFSPGYKDEGKLDAIISYSQSLWVSWNPQTTNVNQSSCYFLSICRWEGFQNDHIKFSWVSMRLIFSRVGDRRNSLLRLVTVIGQFPLLSSGIFER